MSFVYVYLCAKINGTILHINLLQTQYTKDVEFLVYNGKGKNEYRGHCMVCEKN